MRLIRLTLFIVISALAAFAQNVSLERQVKSSGATNNIPYVNTAAMNTNTNFQYNPGTNTETVGVIQSSLSPYWVGPNDTTSRCVLTMSLTTLCVDSNGIWSESVLGAPLVELPYQASLPITLAAGTIACPTCAVPDTTVPASVIGGPGAGSGPTVALQSGSTDLGGQVNVTTGSGPSTSAVIFTLTFGTSHTHSWCTFSPANAGATSQTVSIGEGGNTFTLSINTPALSGTTLYEWAYTCNFVG